MNSGAVATAEETEIKLDEQQNLIPAGPVLVSRDAEGNTHSTAMTLPDVSRLESICEMVMNPEADPAEISRLLTAELATVTKEMALKRNLQSESYKDKSYDGLVKALRELGKQLMDTEVLSKKDILNFDGEKFKFAMSRFVELFVKAMKEAGVLEDTRTNVMKHYRDLMAVAEPTIRRETLKIDSGLRRK